MCVRIDVKYGRGSEWIDKDKKIFLKITGVWYQEDNSHPKGYSSLKLGYG